MLRDRLGCYEMETSNRTIKWIENLAEQELLVRSGEKGSIDICTTKDEVLSVETSSFIRELFHHFSYLVQFFNQRVAEEEIKIKIIRNNENGEGFTLFRNQLRLLVTRPQLGVTQLVCDKKISGAARSSVMFSGLVEAKFGTFHNVEWHFLGSAVNAEQVACHYLTEFIQVSRTFSTVI